MKKIDELKAQKMVVDDICGHGGFAYKCSHRFLVGVPDLFIKLPFLSPMFAECKIKDQPMRSDWVGFDLTPLQRKFLHNAHRVGMLSTGMSFIRSNGALLIAIKTLADLEKGAFMIKTAEHVPALTYQGNLTRIVREFIQSHQT